MIEFLVALPNFIDTTSLLVVVRAVAVKHQPITRRDAARQLDRDSAASCRFHRAEKHAALR